MSVNFRNTHDVATDILVAYLQGNPHNPVFSGKQGKECGEFLGDAYAALLKKLNAADGAPTTSAGGGNQRAITDYNPLDH